MAGYTVLITTADSRSDFPKQYSSMSLGDVVTLADQYGVHEPVTREGRVGFEGGVDVDLRRMEVSGGDVDAVVSALAGGYSMREAQLKNRHARLTVTAADLDREAAGKKPKKPPLEHQTVPLPDGAHPLGLRWNGPAQQTVTRRPRRVDGPMPMVEKYYRPLAPMPLQKGDGPTKYAPTPGFKPEWAMDDDMAGAGFELPRAVPEEGVRTQLPKSWGPDSEAVLAAATGQPPTQLPGPADEVLETPELVEDDEPNAYDPVAEAAKAKAIEEQQGQQQTMLPNLQNPEMREKWEAILAGGWTEEQQAALDRYKANRDAQKHIDFPAEPFAPNVGRGAPPSPPRKFHDLGVKKGGGLKNILKLMSIATPEEIGFYRRWYEMAGADATELANKYELPVEVVTGIIAVMSPNVEWETNVQATEQIIRGQGQRVIDYRKKVDRISATNMMAKLFPDMFVAPATIGAFGYLNSIKKAQSILDAWDNNAYFEKTAPPVSVERWDTDDPSSTSAAAAKYDEATRRNYDVYYFGGGALEKPKKKGEMLEFDAEAGSMIIQPYISGPKVSRFFSSLLNAKAAAAAGVIVLDGHAINIHRGEVKPLDQADASATQAQKDAMSEDYRKAAEIWSKQHPEMPLTGQEVQGITWSVWRGPAVAYLKGWGMTPQDRAKWKTRKGALESVAAGFEIVARAGPLSEKELRMMADSDMPFAVFSVGKHGEREKHDERAQWSDADRHTEMLQTLKALGYQEGQIHAVRGKWWDNTGAERPERAVLVEGISWEDARQITDAYEQDAFIFKDESGVIGMYDFNTGKVRVPSLNGKPLVGAAAVQAAPQKHKPDDNVRLEPARPETGGHPTESAGLPSQQDLVSRSLGVSWQFQYDFDSPDAGRALLPWDGTAPYTVHEVAQAYGPRHDEVPAGPPASVGDPGPGDGDGRPDERAGPAPSERPGAAAGAGEARLARGPNAELHVHAALDGRGRLSVGRPAEHRELADDRGQDAGGRAGVLLVRAADLVG